VVQLLNAGRRQLRSGVKERVVESNGSRSEDKGRSRPEKMVQGRMGRCPFGEALRKTEGRKARNTILSAIKACEQKDTCYCKRNFIQSKKITHSTKEKARSTSG
jgi:hypothetical protein